MADFRRSVEALSSDAPRAIAETIDNTSTWVHRDPEMLRLSIADPYTCNSEGSLRDCFTHPLKYAMGRLGPELEKRGFLESGPPGPAFRAPWHRRDDSDRRPYFPEVVVEWPANLCALANDHGRAFKRVRSLEGQVQTLRREQEEDEARALWTSA